MGAILSTVTPEGREPERISGPRNAIGTCGAASPAAGHRILPSSAVQTAPVAVVAAITSGERPSRNPATARSRKASGSEQNGTRTAAGAGAPQPSGKHRALSTTAGAAIRARMRRRIRTRGSRIRSRYRYLRVPDEGRVSTVWR